MKAWEKYERLKDILGPDELCESFARAMNEDELRDNCDYVARMNDIDWD